MILNLGFGHHLGIPGNSCRGSFWRRIASFARRCGDALVSSQCHGASLVRICSDRISIHWRSWALSSHDFHSLTAVILQFLNISDRSFPSFTEKLAFPKEPSYTKIFSSKPSKPVQALNWRQPLSEHQHRLQVRLVIPTLHDCAFLHIHIHMTFFLECSRLGTLVHKLWIIGIPSGYIGMPWHCTWKVNLLIFHLPYKLVQKKMVQTADCLFLQVSFFWGIYNYIYMRIFQLLFCMAVPGHLSSLLYICIYIYTYSIYIYIYLHTYLPTPYPTLPYYTIPYHTYRIYIYIIMCICYISIISYHIISYIISYDMILYHITSYDIVLYYHIILYYYIIILLYCYIVILLYYILYYIIILYYYIIILYYIMDYIIILLYYYIIILLYYIIILLYYITLWLYYYIITLCNIIILLLYICIYYYIII